MNANLSSKKKSIRARGLSFAMTVALGLVGAGTALIPRPAHAIFGIGDIVFDPGAFARMVVEFGEQAAQWYKEYQRWNQQYQTMRQQVQALQLQTSLAPGSQLQKISPETLNVAERCGDPWGGGVEGLVGRIAKVEMGNNLHQQRYKICSAIQIMRNRQYNEMVEYMQSTGDKINAQGQQVYASFMRGTLTDAQLQESTIQAQRANEQAAHDRDAFEKRMKGYDTFVAMQNENMQILTKNAMRGSGGLLKKVTTAGIMYKQLCGASGSQCKTN